MKKAVSTRVVGTPFRCCTDVDIARRTAEHLGVRYFKTHMNENALADAFEEATYHIEHHSHDLNYIGKFVLSSLPRRHGYKVVLTGEGADEQFGGYPLFLPDFIRGQGGDHGPFGTIVKESYNLIGANTSFFSEKTSLNLATPAAMSSFTPTSIFRTESPISPVETIVNNIPEEVRLRIKTDWHALHSSQYVWQKGHLANQFLSCLGDRVEMAHSIEARTPFLDHILTSYVNHLPPSIKIRAVPGKDNLFTEKYALRQAVKPFVTEEVYKRTKHAYTAPTTYPVDGPVNRLLRRLVNKENVENLGFVEWAKIDRLMEVAFDPEGHEESGKVWAWRQLVMVAQWVVLAHRFGVQTATI